MDLRKLYEAIIASNHLRRSQRVTLNKKCYNITYEIHNKYLSIKSIKRVSSHISRKKSSIGKCIYESCIPFSTQKWTRSHSYKRGRFRGNRKYSQNPSSLISSVIVPVETDNAKVQATPECDSHETQTDGSEMQGTPTQALEEVKITKTTQTTIRTYKTQQTYMDPKRTYSKCEQTIVSVYSQGTQAEVFNKVSTISFGITTKPQTSNICNQTEEFYCTMATQATPMNAGIEIQTDFAEITEEDILNQRKDSVVLLLGGLSDALYNQNEQFENVVKSIEELFGWVICFQNFFKMRKRVFIKKIKKIRSETIQ